MSFCLRPVRESDLETIRIHRNEPATQRWLERQMTIDAPTQRRWFEQGGASCFRIIQKNGTDIGLARLKPSDDGDLCTVGLDLFRAFRGQRLASPAFQVVVQEGLNMARQLDLWAFLDNVYAIRTYLQTGFGYDHSTPARFYTREDKGVLGVHAYVRMIYQRNP